MFTDENNRLNELIKQLGAQHGLNAQDAYDIALHQFEFLKDVIRTTERNDLSTHKSVNIMYFGRFKVKTRINRLAKENEQLFRMITEQRDRDISGSTNDKGVCGDLGQGQDQNQN